MFAAFHDNAFAPLIIFGVASFVTMILLVRSNGKTLNKLGAKVEKIEQAVNGTPEGDSTIGEKVTAIGDEQTRVAAELTNSQDVLEHKVDELLQHDAERDTPGARYGNKDGSVDS